MHICKNQVSICLYLYTFEFQYVEMKDIHIPNTYMYCISYMQVQKYLSRLQVYSQEKLLHSKIGKQTKENAEKK